MNYQYQVSTHNTYTNTGADNQYTNQLCCGGQRADAITTITITIITITTSTTITISISTITITVTLTSLGRVGEGCVGGNYYTKTEIVNLDKEVCRSEFETHQPYTQTGTYNLLTNSILPRGGGGAGSYSFLEGTTPLLHIYIYIYI